jgi:hypothetical protein
MQARLSRAAVQLREQFDDAFSDRDKASDGWIGDTRHAARKSDHSPDEQNWVHALDIDRDLSGKAKPDLMPDLVDQIRTACKKGSEKRIAYIIFDGKICSPILRWKWRKYTGANKHNHHVHFSFKKEAQLRGEFYQIPMLGGTL